MNPKDYGMEYKSIKLVTRDKENLDCYLITGSDITLVYFHANAGNMGHRLPIAQVFHKLLGCNILMLSYRGYGRSTGTPSEDGLKIDVQTAMDYIQNTPELAKTKLILYGQSIGGACAIYAASKYQFDALIVENTFTSLPQVIPHAMPLLTLLKFLCNQYWDSLQLVKTFRNQSILFLSGEKDEIVPPLHMRELYQVAKTANSCKFVSFENGTHNDTCVQPEYFEHILEFIKSL